MDPIPKTLADFLKDGASDRIARFEKLVMLLASAQYQLQMPSGQVFTGVPMVSNNNIVIRLIATTGSAPGGSLAASGGGIADNAEPFGLELCDGTTITVLTVPSS